MESLAKSEALAKSGVVTVDPSGTIEGLKRKIQELGMISTQQSLTVVGVPDDRSVGTMKNDNVRFTICDMHLDDGGNQVKIGGNSYEGITILAKEAKVLNGNQVSESCVGRVDVESNTYKDVRVSTQWQTSGRVTVLNGDKVGGADFFSF